MDPSSLKHLLSSDSLSELPPLFPNALLAQRLLVFSVCLLNDSLALTSTVRKLLWVGVGAGCVHVCVCKCLRALCDEEVSGACFFFRGGGGPRKGPSCFYQAVLRQPSVGLSMCS